MEKISWMSVLKIAVIIIVIFGCCAAWKWFFNPSAIQTMPSDIVWTTTPQNINAQENYKATYELFDSHFSQLITLFALFGIVVPIGAYLLQSKSLKEERERMEKSLNEKIKEIDDIRIKAEDSEKAANKAQMDAEKSLVAANKAQMDAEKSLVAANKANEQLQEEIFDNSSSLAVAFGGFSKIFSSMPENSSTYRNVQISNIMQIYYYAKIKMKDNCIKVMEEMKNAKKSNSPINVTYGPDIIKTIQQCLEDKYEEFKNIYNDIVEPPID